LLREILLERATTAQVAPLLEWLQTGESEGIIFESCKELIRRARPYVTTSSTSTDTTPNALRELPSWPLSDDFIYFELDGFDDFSQQPLDLAQAPLQEGPLQCIEDHSITLLNRGDGIDPQLTILKRAIISGGIENGSERLEGDEVLERWVMEEAN
jgi:hypothetical protein